MNQTTRIPFPLRALDWSVSLYTALLVLYPADYRRAYGAHMTQLFRDLARDAARCSGSAGLLSLWLMAGFDLLKSAVEERRRAPLRLTRAGLQRVLNLCLIAGGACFAIASYSQLQPYTHYVYRGLYQTSISFLYPAIVLLALGSAGLAWSVWHRASPLARLMTAAAWTGMVIICAALLGSALIPGDQDWSWHLAMLGLILHFAGLGLFGLINLRARLIGRWTALPALMGAAFFSLWLFGLTGSEPFGPQWGAFLIFAGLGLGYILIGVSLRRAARSRGITA